MTKNDFAKFLRGFFTEYLSAERGVSSNTLRSYGTAFASYLDFMRVKREVDAEKLTLEHMGAKMSLTIWTGCKLTSPVLYRPGIRGWLQSMLFADICSTRMSRAYINGRKYLVSR